MPASVLPAFPCPRCEVRAFHKQSVACTPESPDIVQSLAHLYVCHACGENYLSTVSVQRDGARTETWDYYLERDTQLRRVRRYEPAGAYALAESDPLFVLDGAAVTEAAWRAALGATRSQASPLVERSPEALIDRWRVLWATPIESDRPAPLRLLAPDFSQQRRSA